MAVILGTGVSGMKKNVYNTRGCGIFAEYKRIGTAQIRTDLGRIQVLVPQERY